MHLAWLVPSLLALFVAVPPLTPEQHEQVRTAIDLIRRIDEPALYPLLNNALAWTAGDEAGATIPDYASLRRDLDAHRGALFLIEGALVKDPTPVTGLARPGPWDARLSQWVILPDQKQDEVIVLYLVTPPDADSPRPRAGQRVRLPARLYKLWNDEAEVPRSYLAFVGSTVGLTGGRAGGSERLAVPPAAMVAAVLVLLAIFAVALRRLSSAGREPAAVRAREREREATAAARRAAEARAGDGSPLPEDPAEALDELRRRTVGDGEDM